MALHESRQEFLAKIGHAEVVDKTEAIAALAKDKIVLDAGFLNHTMGGYRRSGLHERLAEVSTKVIGIDTRYKKSSNLKDCFFGDMTIRLIFNYYFDLVVAADLIEHLNNFEGFFNNCSTLLKGDGKLILTTPTPFYVDSWVYSWLKSDELVNPDHTCWIDPFNMRELLDRHNFEIEKFYWLNNRWNLAAFITQRKERWYNHEIANWEGKQVRIEKMVLPFSMAVWIGLRKLFTLFSPLNRWPGYMVVCKRKGNK